MRLFRAGVPALLLGAAALLPSPALAVDVQSETAVSSQKTLGDYLADLEGDSDPDRLFAARVLRGELRRALHAEAHAPHESLAWLDARALLIELEARLPQGCRVAVRFKNSTAPCADIFALLEDTAALPTLREVLAAETRPGVRKQLEKAITSLEALAPAAAPANPPNPAASEPAPSTPPAVP